jgi:ribonuclease Z
MRILGRAIVALMLIGAIGAAVAWQFQSPIARYLLEANVRANIGAPPLASFEDGLHVGLCGSGGPLPNTVRDGPCVTAITGESVFVFDAGAGAAGNLGVMRVPAGNIRAIFLTHFHSDHIDGLGEVLMNRWIQAGHTTPVDVFGPEGVEGVVNGFNVAYALDATYRTAHHGPKIAPPSGTGATPRTFALPADENAAVVVYEKDDVKISAFLVGHAPIAPAVGYRIDYKGRSAVISGDTIPVDSIRLNARGVDVLVHEALQTSLISRVSELGREAGNDRVATIMHDILDYHTSPEQAAEIAQAAGVKHLLLYHIVPPLPGAFFEGAFLGDARNRFDGPITVGTDGVMFTLPPDSDEITIRNLM